MDQKCYCRHQAELIQKAKWLEGEKLGKDPGPQFVERWVQHFAKKYREEYRKEYNALVQSTAETVILKMKEKVPGVSNELWSLIIQTIIDEFTALWMKELVLSNSESKSLHLEEI